MLISFFLLFQPLFGKAIDENKKENKSEDTDGLDINNCRTPTCFPWDFRCNTGDCINMAKFCDGNVDCPDASDEFVVAESHASDNLSIACDNRANPANITCQLPASHTCDNYPVCSGDVDESEALCGGKRYKRICLPDSMVWCTHDRVLSGCVGCESLTAFCSSGYCSYIGADPLHRCASHIFRCGSGECIGAEQFCDGVADCEDRSDEITFLSNSTKGECSSCVADNGVMCKNKWNYAQRRCLLPEQFVCDGIDHCEDREDECGEGCEYSFHCLSSGKCLSKLMPSIPTHFRDGRDDCGDSSDEWFVSNPYDPHNRYFKCNDKNNTKLAMEKFCDGIPDCPNGVDERNSTDSGELMCKNKYVAQPLECVVPDHHICDKVELCEDRSDEADCDFDLDRYFTCDNGVVIKSLSGVRCNFISNCCDDSDECGEKVHCNETFTCESDGKCLAFERFCDGKQDCSDGSDERRLDRESNHTVSCSNAYNMHEGECILPERYVCDGLNHCQERKDECERGCKSSFFCSDEGECLERNEFCDGKTDCPDSSDERRFGIGFKCGVRRDGDSATCVLPQSMLFDAVDDCSDLSDRCSISETTCFRCLSSDLRLSLKQVCDGVFDCPDLSDECLCEKSPFNLVSWELCRHLCIDTSESKAMCKRCKLGQIACDRGDSCVWPHQLCDGDANCHDGTDETVCPQEAQKENNVPLPTFRCKNMGGEMLAVQCDGVIECLDFSDECPDRFNSSVGKPTRPASSNFTCGANTSAICFLLHPDEFHFYHCNNKPIFPSEICNGKEYCRNSSWPDSRRENAELMGRGWDDFSVDERSCGNRFRCELSRPVNDELVTIGRNQVCDGTVDCLLGEDEAEELCASRTRRFYCESRREMNLTEAGLHRSNYRTDPLFVDGFMVFDGKEDCLDGSDECPSSEFDRDPFASRYRMIKDAFLSGFVWVVAFVALIGNAIVIGHTVRRIRRQRLTPMMKTNCVLVLNLAIADFLMGVYLLALAAKNAETVGEYCKFDKEWRTSSACSSLGTLAIISIQSSVLVLVILTTYRVMAVLRPFSADSVDERLTCLLIAGAWLIATVVAVVPRMVALEDYFQSAAWLSTSVYFFATNTPKKETLQRFVAGLEALNLTGKGEVNVTSLQTADFSWQMTRENLNNLYPTFWSHFEIEGYFGFYGSNAVCLPQMFVTTETSSWAYAVGMISCDVIACFYVGVSYVIIYNDAKRVVSSNRSNEENRTMQARITRLVLTDFACWLPVSVLTALNLAGVPLSPTAYPYTAIILLPINSALNPILYSNVTSLIFNSCVKRISALMRKHAIWRQESFSNSRQRSTVSRTSTTTAHEDTLPPENLPMLAQRPKNGSALFPASEDPMASARAFQMTELI